MNGEFNGRKKLRDLEGVRSRFSGIVSKFGEKPGYRDRPPLKTILINDVKHCLTGELVTDHLWFTSGKWSEGLKIGDTIYFDARVSEYKKGYRGSRSDVFDAPQPSIDFRLERPTKISKL